MGSMVACASSGSSYTAENVLAADLSAAAGLPLFFGQRVPRPPRRPSQGALRSRHYRARRWGPDPRRFSGPLRALQRLPEMIGHHDHAARGAHHAPHARHIRQPPSPPTSALPPSVGQSAITAYSMPGNRTSRPNSALPSTLPGVSSRASGRADQPKITLRLERNVLRHRKLGGGLRQLAVAQHLPRRARDPSVLARHWAGSTRQRSAAAAVSIMRAWAPAVRSLSQAS